ncbi:MAG: autotransporter-associated beta strand repeat-containing protein [Puniceicoccales bacterium]|jgi:autotransporter-associated beta strand protein|nr:autotransporter-associated beta strand repeat-containing protein [Puniceicoccales bacterium]
MNTSLPFAKTLLISAAVLAFSSAAIASTYSWNGGNGNWTTDSKWLVDGGPTPAMWQDGNDVLLDNASSGTLTLGSTISQTGITVNGDNDWTISGAGVISGAGQLIKNGSGILTIANTNNNTFTGDTVINGGTIALGTGGTGSDTATAAALGTGDVAINSGGTLKLWIQNSKTFTIANKLHVDGGTIYAEDGKYILTGDIALGTNGMTLQNRWDGKNITVNSVISGAGAVTIKGSSSSTAAVVFSQKNTYTGGTIVQSGWLDLNSGGATGAIRGTVTVQSGATLRLTVGDATGYGTTNQLNKIVLNGGTLLVNTGGTGSNQTFSNLEMVLTGASVTGIANSNIDMFSGSTKVTTLASGITSQISVTTLSLRQANSVFDVAQGTTTSGVDLNIVSNIQEKEGVRNLTKQGDGVLSFSGANTYTGTTQINGGTLKLAASGTLATSAIIVNSGGTFQIDTTGKTLKALTLNDGSILNITGTVGETTTVTGELTIGTGNITVIAPISGAANVNDVIDLITAGSIVNNGTLTGANIAGSRIQGTISVNSNKLQFLVTQAAANLVWANTQGNGIWETNGNANFSGIADGKFMTYDSVTFDDTVGAGDKTITLTSDLNSGGITVNNSNGDYTFGGTGKINGNGELVKSGTGKLTFGSGITYLAGGPITVNAGTLNLGSKSITTSGVTLVDGTIEAGTITASLVNLQSGTLSANLAGATNLGKTTTETATISGTNTHTGTNLVSAGTLVVASTGALGTGATVINSGAQLNVEVNNYASSGHGKIQIAGGTLALKGGNSFSGNMGSAVEFTAPDSKMTTYGAGTATYSGYNDVNGSSINVLSGVTGAEIGENIILKSGGSYGFRMDVDGEITVKGTINATGSAHGAAQSGSSTVGDASYAKPSLWKKGSGNLTLTGVATLDYGLSLQAGTLTLSGSDNRLAANTSVSGGMDNLFIYLGSTANTNGTLALDGINQTVGGIKVIGTGTGNAIVGASTTMSTLTVNNGTADSTYTGRIGGTGANQNNISLAKAGASTLTLSGTNTYTGTTTITGGTLKLSSTGSIAQSNLISVQTGAFFDVTDVANFTIGSGQTLGGTGTVMGAVTVASGGILSPGNSPGTLSFADNVTLQSGAKLVIEINGNGAGQHDMLNFTGTNKTLTFEDGSQLYFDIGAGVTANDINNLLITSSGSSVVKEGLVGISSSNGWTLELTQSGQVSVIAIPEPSTYALIGAALAIGIVAIRRRRKS